MIAAGVANDNSPEKIVFFRQARAKAKLVELGPGATVQVSLEPVSIGQ